MPTYQSQDIPEAVELNDTSFGTRIADTTVNRLDIPATYPPNTERHKLIVNGSEVRDFTASAKFTNQPGKWQVTASAGDTVEFASREKLRYVPNYEVLFGAVAWYDSQPDPDQRLYVELSDDARENGYRYELTPGDSSISIISGGSTVTTVPESEWGEHFDALERDHNPFDFIERTNPINPRGKVNWYGAGNFRAGVSYTRASGTQYNPTLGKASNQDDIATEEINLRVRVVAEADAGASDFTVNIGSLGGVIRGNAEEFDRAKSFTVPALGGAIGETFAGNEPVLAVRKDPALPQVALELLPPKYEPGGTDVMEMMVFVVDAADTDASGWQTPNVQAGPESASQNTAHQATTNVSTFPTAQKTNVKGTTVEAPVPDRLLTSTVASGSKRGGGEVSETAGEIKRGFDDDEVVLFVPRQLSGSDGSIEWLTVNTEQDW